MLMIILKIAVENRLLKFTRIKEWPCPENMPKLGVPLEYQSQPNAQGQQAPAYVWTGEILSSSSSSSSA
eukprot:3703764-Karenia_brevis.AAC.1